MTIATTDINAVDPIDPDPGVMQMLLDAQDLRRWAVEQALCLAARGAPAAISDPVAVAAKFEDYVLNGSKKESG